LAGVTFREEAERAERRLLGEAVKVSVEGRLVVTTAGNGSGRTNGKTSLYLQGES